ncbi:MAG: ATPase, T2SS/T4P/T4SS family [Anaerolineae bacterium]
MSIFDRLNEPAPENGDNPRKDADKGREPKLVSGQLGRRLISQAALLEKVTKAFIAEYASSERLKDADTQTKRIKLILEVVTYTLAVESVNLDDNQKAQLIADAYGELFGYGPLDALFADERITTIVLEGTDKSAVRYGHSELTSIAPLFDDAEHIQRIIGRLLLDAGAELREGTPYIETGLMVGSRPICLNLMAPPVTAQLTADIRLHPAVLPTLENLVAQNFMDEKAAEFLRALVSSPHGFLIVGDTESGKTTLLSILAQMLPSPETVVSVERAGEMRLPPGAQRLMTQWAAADQPGKTFGAQISAALERNPACILLDEVRADEPETIAPLLSDPNPPRQIWSFRGTVEAKRLHSALGMLARRANMARAEEMAIALNRRLPFAITLRRRSSQLQIYNIGEWAFQPDAEYPTYKLLMELQDGILQPTGHLPHHELNLPQEFWLQR